VLKTIELEKGIPHNYALWTEFDGKDVWVGTSKGLAKAIGTDYFAGLRIMKDEFLAQSGKSQSENGSNLDPGN